MLRTLALLVAVALPARAHAQPCDPYSSEVEIPIPPALQLRKTCGNGHIDSYATSCVKYESGGCGHPTRSSQRCTKTQEVCDGKAFGESSCKAFGFAGGTLRCASTCDRVELDRCAACLSPATCHEQVVGALDFQDITVIAQGPTIRAFWYDDQQYYVADVDAKGNLGARRTLAAMGSFRLVPMQIGTSALTIVGPMETPQLSVVPAKGAATLVPLPGRSGTLFLPLLPVVGKDLGLAIVGEPYEAKILLVDPAGKSQPLTAVYAQNAYRRSALVPLAPGKHVIRWSKYEADVVTEKGDVLWLMFDYRLFAYVVHNGSVVQLTAPRELAGPEQPTVAIDGASVASFGTTEDVIGGVKHALPTKTPAVKLLAPRAYDGGVSIARTATREVHAAHIAHGDADPDTARATLAIAVRALAP
ncbi:MAG TPA: hypothetical protein VFQ53_36585 [Kofleriaceae bacterium]|nr:hypothetical protein [Kofleriaceae bacterium]